MIMLIFHEQIHLIIYAVLLVVVQLRQLSITETINGSQVDGKSVSTTLFEVPKKRQVKVPISEKSKAVHKRKRPNLSIYSSPNSINQIQSLHIYHFISPHQGKRVKFPDAVCKKPIMARPSVHNSKFRVVPSGEAGK